jgi:protein gp37
MSSNSTIEWTDMTWITLAGCTRVGCDCDECHAVRMSYRLECQALKALARGENPGRKRHYIGVTSTNARGMRHFNGTVNPIPEALGDPLLWSKPRRVFVNSMGDTFHRNVPGDFILEMFHTMVRTPQHQFQVLTKRPERVLELDDRLPWQRNIWLGVSVGHEDYLSRADLLRQTSAHLRFLSCEPLLGPLPHLNLDGIRWVIIGGESGPRARPCNLDWIRQIKDRCVVSGVKIFVKQLGIRPEERGRAVRLTIGGNPVRGKNSEMDTWPQDLRIREWPIPMSEGGADRP